MNKTTNWIIGGVLGLAGLTIGMSSFLGTQGKLQIGFITQSTTGSSKLFKVCTDHQCALSKINDGSICDDSSIGAYCDKPKGPCDGKLGDGSCPNPGGSSQGGNHGGYCDSSGCNNSGSNNGSGEQICGNGILDQGEQCDDGNTNDGDGCNSVCRIENPPVPSCPRDLKISGGAFGDTTMNQGNQNITLKAGFYEFECMSNDGNPPVSFIQVFRSGSSTNYISNPGQEILRAMDNNPNSYKVFCGGTGCGYNIAVTGSLLSSGATYGCVTLTGDYKTCQSMLNGPFTEPSCNNSCNTPPKKYKVCTDYQCGRSDTNSDGTICDNASIGAECKKPNDPPHGKYKVCTNYQCAWSNTNTDGKICDSAPVGATCKPANGTGQ